MGFIRFMHDGGPFMYLILLIALFGLAIAIERFVFLRGVKKHNKAVWAAVQPHLQKGNSVEIQQKLKNSSSEVARVLDAGLEAVNANGNDNYVENAFEEGLLEAIPRLEVRINYLAVLSNLATLAGLLGTVVGMIGAFKSVATADPALKGDMLSKAISEAMNCTAFGLGTAIPLIIAYAFLHNYSQQVIESIEMISLKVQNHFRLLRGSR